MKARPLLWVLLLLGGSGCRGCRLHPDHPSGDDSDIADDTGDTASPVLLELGTVWSGSTVARRLWLPALPADARVDTVELPGTASARLDIAAGTLDLWWIPEGAGAVDQVLVLGSASYRLTAEIEASPSPWPDPSAESIGVEGLDMLPETGWSDADFPATGHLPWAADPVNGDMWFGSPSQGRAWRLDSFYNHSPQGLWVPKDIERRGTWSLTPPCFDDTSGMLQDGTCTGAERDQDGSIPGNWRYLHGGFAGGDGEGDDPSFLGMSALVADPERGRVWVLGQDSAGGWISAIDADLLPSPEEGEDPYTFRQPVPDLRESLGTSWRDLRAGLWTDRLWVVSLETGAVGWTSDPASGALVTLATLTAPLQAAVRTGDILWVLGEDALFAVSLAEGGAVTESARPEGLPATAPQAAAAGWLVWPEVALHIADDGALTWVLPPEEGAVFADLVEDTVEADGTAEALSVLYAVGQDAAGGAVLWAGAPHGGWLGTPIALPATPRALAYAADPHDLHILYAAGSEGCTTALLSPLCVEGQRPPVVHSLYNPYGLVPPTSGGHPLNLFLSPVAETPKDNDFGTDFSLGRCQTAADLSVGCCALEYAIDQRLIPNVTYFEDVIQALGSTTADTPTLVWGLNPTLMLQARLCLESRSAADQAVGIQAWEQLLALPGDRSSVSAWTHTGAGDGILNPVQDQLVVVSEETGYTAPVSDQAEYRMLHNGMAAVFDPSRLPAAAGDLRLADPDTLWTPLVSGNCLDAWELWNNTGWADPDWLTPARDAPLSIDQPPRSAYYFMSAGVDLEVGLTAYRKKELYPLDLRERAALRWLNTDITSPGEPDPGSAVLLMPGMSWEVGTIGVLSEAGAFRETLRFAVTVEEEDWILVERYLRRLIASSRADTVKSWYLHIFDVTNPSGLYTANSGVTSTLDITRDALLRIRDDLITPGYARWALPEEILEEYDAR